MKFYKPVLAIPLFAVMFLIGASAHAGQIQLSWQAPSTPPDFVTYRIYWGEKSGTYPNHKDVKSDQTSVTISNLAGGKTYYFVATTITDSGKESKHSNEASVYLDTDTDKDGILDQEEIKTYGTDPNRADTDGDGISDGKEIAFWKDAWDGDADGDGKINLLDSDSDNDGTSDADEISAGFDPGDKNSTPPDPNQPAVKELLPIAAVSASGAQTFHTAARAIDGDIATRWKAEGDGHWLMFDLGSQANVGEVNIAWVVGDRRAYSFAIETSLDGNTWNEAFSGDSSGSTADFEPYAFAATSARYVRILGYGNAWNMWNIIAEVEIYGLSNIVPLPIAAASASAARDPYVAPNSIDGDMTTRWAAEGDGQWLMFDLGTIAAVNQAAIAWVKGDERTAAFSIEASLDGNTWKEVYNGDSSGTTAALEPYSFTSSVARYVRIAGYGNSSNRWNNIAEVELYGLLGTMSLPIAAASASAARDPYVAPNSIDGDMTTRWAAEGDGQWLMFDLGATATVGEIAIAWVKGNERTASFSVEVSPDGNTWNEVFTGNSSGNTTALESYSFAFATARYVRIVGHGNSSNRWNNIAEVEIGGIIH